VSKGVRLKADQLVEAERGKQVRESGAEAQALGLS
jgi:hypothetical protein